MVRFLVVGLFSTLLMFSAAVAGPFEEYEKAKSDSDSGEMPEAFIATQAGIGRFWTVITFYDHNGLAVIHRIRGDKVKNTLHRNALEIKSCPIISSLLKYAEVADTINNDNLPISDLNIYEVQGLFHRSDNTTVSVNNKTVSGPAAIWAGQVLRAVDQCLPATDVKLGAPASSTPRR